MNKLYLLHAICNTMLLDRGRRQGIKYQQRNCLNSNIWTCVLKELRRSQRIPVDLAGEKGEDRKRREKKKKEKRLAEGASKFIQQQQKIVKFDFKYVFIVIHFFLQ